MSRYPEPGLGPNTIDSRPLFVLQAKLSGVQFHGPTPSGTRKIVAVAGGNFEGKRLRGVVLPEGGHDWALVRNDGTLTLDVRLTLVTDDDAVILMTYRGIRHEKGTEQYFRIAPFFETGHERYAWLNDIVSVGLGTRPAEGPRYDVHEIL